MTGQERQRLIASLHSILIKRPGLNKHQLLQILLSEDWGGITTSDINKILYYHPGLFKQGAESLPLWYAIKQSQKQLDLFLEARKPSEIPEYYKGPPPRAWQLEAFASWKAAGRRGVIEAVTGTGKTTVGILAAADALLRGSKVMVLVPGIDLLNQWFEKLTLELPDFEIGRFGGNNKDSLKDFEIIISTVQSAYRSWILPNKTKGLIIADEVHHYGADKYFEALEDAFAERLGLTATFERQDNRINEFLAPYFYPKKAQSRFANSVVFNCGYSRGLGDSILAPFKVGFLPVEFSPTEWDNYEKNNDICSVSKKNLIFKFGCPKEPFGEFIKAVQELKKKRKEEYYGSIEAGRFLKAFTEIKRQLAGCKKKIASMKILTKVFRSSDRALVFTETIESAFNAAKRIQRSGITAFDYSSNIPDAELELRMALFKSGLVKVLTGPHKLDEGIDVPEADAGVILAASRTRRQMIQRMGRIIRPKEDGRSATFFIVYVRSTYEDPELGAHGAFLNEIMDFAESVEYFGPEATPKELLDWYLA